MVLLGVVSTYVAVDKRGQSFRVLSCSRNAPLDFETSSLPISRMVVQTHVRNHDKHDKQKPRRQIVPTKPFEAANSTVIIQIRSPHCDGQCRPIVWTTVVLKKSCFGSFATKIIACLGRVGNGALKLEHQDEQSQTNSERTHPGGGVNNTCFSHHGYIYRMPTALLFRFINCNQKSATGGKWKRWSLGKQALLTSGSRLTAEAEEYNLYWFDFLLLMLSDHNAVTI